MNQQTKIAVLGYGVESQSTCAYLKKHGFSNVTVFDTRTYVDTIEGYPCVFAEDALKQLVTMEVVFRTPGISYNHPNLVAARDAGVEITSQVEYFLQHAKGMTIGVTGTKGKTTTSTFMHHLLHEAGKDVHLIGNMGNGMLDVLDGLTEESISLMELSSFQLMGCRYSPHIAVALAVTPEHLDYHLGLEEYYEAKYNITAHQSSGDILIVYKDNHVSHSYGEKSKATVYSISPQGEVDQGAYLKQEHTILKWNSQVEPISFEGFSLPGKHQRINAMPGLLIARLLGISVEKIEAAMKSFGGVEHRLEHIGQVHNVEFYNDSAGTTPEAATAALRAMSKPTWMILGGSEKGVDFDQFAKDVLGEKHLQGIFFVGGSSGPRIRTAIEIAGGEELDIPLISLDHFRDLPATWYEYVQPGEVILLAPAAASFDEFENYKQRGECFRSMAKGF